MEQNASAALIASIVAVVLAALGLVGGVIGYVQGTAALRRATLIRQRAAAAEEAALQARTQAEQAVRTARQIVDRLNGLQVRSLGDVADLPTGPLILPSRVAPSTEPASFRTAVPPAPATSPTRVPVRASVDPPPVVPSADEKARPEPLALELPVRGQEPLPDQGAAPAPEPVVDGTPEPAPDSASQEQAGTDGESASPTAEAVSEPAPPVEPAPRPRAGGPEPEPQPEPESERGGPALEPEPESKPEPAAARSSTGQVTAGLRDVPPLDWAEALRTGAIPLPKVSRGTYAAPRKRSTDDPEAPVRFELRAVGRQRFEAVNVGGVTAEGATVEGTGEDRNLVRPADSAAVPVGPGKSLAFSVLRVEGRRISVRVSWLREGGRQTSVDLPLP